jgi:hypothetical protein
MTNDELLARIKLLEDRVRELERQLEDARDYAAEHEEDT